MKKIENTLKKDLIHKILCLIIIAFAGVLLYVGLQIYTDTMYQHYSKSFHKGQIAEEDLLVNNSIDIYNEKETNELKEKNAAAVLPVFNYSLEKTLSSIGKYDLLKNSVKTGDFEVVTSLCGEDVSLYLEFNNPDKVLSVSYEILKELLEFGILADAEVQNVRRNGYDSVLICRNNKESVLFLDNDVITDSNLVQNVNKILTKYEDYGLSFTEGNIINGIISSLALSNVQYDDFITQNRRADARNNTDPVYISFEKGQVLLSKDKVITKEQLDLIELLGSSARITFSDVLGESIFILLTMVFAFFLLCYFLGSEKYHRIQYLWMTTVALVLTCVAAFFAIRKATSLGISFVESCIPVCFAPVLITMITGKRNYGYITAFLVGLLISAIPGSTYLTIIYCTMCGMSSCALVRFFYKRTDMVIQWAASLVVTSVLTALFIFIGAFSNHELIYDLIGNIFHVTLTQIVIAIILPLLERIFVLPTVFRLNELAFDNNPVLAKLSEVAPGTSNHSKMVSELAEAASKTIGANAFLAKVGGLFHDIGKIEHPEYFVENQNGTNKHEDLNPGVSVAVIKSHVKVGEDMGREAGLPIELIDIIANHHGNDVISYFYNEAKKQFEGVGDLPTTDFSYSNSSVPETKECAIVMLADSVEAASRTIAEPTAGKFSKMINSIFLGKIERGQLDNCDISMKELDAIKDCFLKKLSAQHHNRIEYPDEENDK